MNVDIKNRYKGYDKRVIETISLLTSGMEIEPQYIVTLDLIAENYQIMYTALDDIKAKGATMLSPDGKYLMKNHQVQLFNTAQQTLIKLLANFSSNPLSKARITKLSTVDDETSPLDEFLND